MRRLAVPLVLLLAALPAWAAPLAIEGPKQADPYKLVELAAVGDLAGGAVLWDLSPEDLADVRELPGGRMLFTGPPGSYRAKCRVIRLKDGATLVETARAVVVIGTPTPPAPVPPPAPADPLTAALQAAWAQEADAGKATQAKTLAALYRQTAALADNPAVTTTGQLFDAFKAAETTLGLTPTTLPKLRRSAADWLAGQIGTASGPIDRAKTREAFGKLAALVEVLK